MWITVLPANTPHLPLPRSLPEGATTEWTVIAPADEADEVILINRPREDETLNWPCWLTYSGWFTHINGSPSAAGPVQTSESSPAETDVLPPSHPNIGRVLSIEPHLSQQSVTTDSSIDHGNARPTYTTTANDWMIGVDDLENATPITPPRHWRSTSLEVCGLKPRSHCQVSVASFLHQKTCWCEWGFWRHFSGTKKLAGIENMFYFRQVSVVILHRWLDDRLEIRFFAKRTTKNLWRITTFLNGKLA